MTEEYRVRLTPGDKALLEKRFKFRCWKCGEVYSIFREADLNQKLSVSCPFCGAKADVNFGVRAVKQILRTQNAAEDGVVFKTFDLPDILPTNPAEE